MRKYLILVVFISLACFIYFKDSHQNESLKLDETSSVEKYNNPNIDIPSERFKSPKENNTLIKSEYLPSNTFEKIQTEIEYISKEYNTDILKVENQENKILVKFNSGNEDTKNLINLLQKLNFELYLKFGEYRAILDKNSGNIEIKKLNDLFSILSEQIIEKNKNITLVKLEYETPLQEKPIYCVNGEEWKIQKKFHEKNNCDDVATQSLKVLKIIENFYLKNTPEINIEKFNKDILPLWYEMFDKNYTKNPESNINSAPGYDAIFLCYPDNKTIMMELGCNFRLMLKK